MLVVQGFLIAICFVGVSYAGSSSLCEPFESNIISSFRDITFILELKVQFAIDWNNFLGPYSVNPLVQGTNLNCALYPILIANLTARISETLTPDQVLGVIEGTLTPPPQPLDCIYEDLMILIDLVQKTCTEIIESIKPPPSRDLTLTNCEDISAFKTELTASIETMLTRRIEYIRAQIATLSCHKDILANYLIEQKITEKYWLEILISEALQVDIQDVRNFLNGNVVGIPKILECIGDVAIPLIKKYEDLVLESVESVMNPCN